MHKNGMLAAVGVGVLALGLLGSVPAAVGADERPTSRLAGDFIPGLGDLDASASAIPSVQMPSVTDSEDESAYVLKGGAKAVASSIATSDCEGCDATSTVLHVLRVLARDGIAADNSAVAWSSCVGCGSSAVSVQVVVARDPAVLRVNNRALALNLNCDGCTTTAAAIQLVFAGTSWRDISAQARDAIAQLEADLADRLSAAGSPGARQFDGSTPESLAEETAAQVEQVVTADLGTAAVQRSVSVQVAG